MFVRRGERLPGLLHPEDCRPPVCKICCLIAPVWSSERQAEGRLESLRQKVYCLVLQVVWL